MHFFFFLPNSTFLQAITRTWGYDKYVEQALASWLSSHVTAQPAAKQNRVFSQSMVENDIA